MVRQEFREITELDALVCKLQHENEKYKELLLGLVSCIEKAANNTHDPETFKVLTVTFNNLKDDLKCI